MPAHTGCQGRAYTFFWQLLIFLILHHPTAWAGGAAVVDLAASHQQALSLTRYLEVLEDPTATLQIDDVRSQAHASQFQVQNTTTEALSFGFTRSAYWFRLTLHNPTDQTQTRLFEVANYALSHVDFYAPTDDANTYRATRTGSALPFSSRTVDNRYFVFPVQVPAHNQQVVYLRVMALDGLLVPARLWSEAGFYAHSKQDYIGQALYYGIVLAMVLFNLLLFVVLRDNMFLLYVGFEVVFALALASFGGLAHEFLWPGAEKWSDIAHFVGWSLGFILGGLFFRGMMKECIKNTWLDKWFNILIICYTVAIIGKIISIYYFFILSVTLNAISALTLIYSLYYGIKRKNRPSYFLSAAFIMVAIGGLMAVGRSLGLFPTNFVTVNGMQIGSALEMIILGLALADRFNQIRKEKAADQQKLFEAQERLLQSLQDAERELNEKVDLRTAELKAANIQSIRSLRLAETAKECAEAAQIQAEEERQEAIEAREQTAQAMAQLQSTQTQLIAAEKMASLGLLVSNVAHEINTPIGAVKSSGTLLADSLKPTLVELPRLMAKLDEVHQTLFAQLVFNEHNETAAMSVREERARTKEIASQLDQAGTEDAQRKARLLMKLRAHDNPLTYLPLLQHPESDLILEVASNIADVVNSTYNINQAVERVSRVVYALKALSGDDVARIVVMGTLQDDMDHALAKYQNQMQKVALLKTYQADMPAIQADHDAIMQLCIHLVMNALQAMNYTGTLTVGLAAENNQAVITVSDTGSGITDDIKDRIFEPFFTTRTSGEGSGMGLAIVKRIVEQHKGQIAVHTQVNIGTTFSVSIPTTT